VLAFPVNEYFSQEPGTNAQIAKYVEGSGTHKYPFKPRATWTGTVVPPAVLFAKTSAFGGADHGPAWDPKITGSWCNSSSSSACAPSSAGCCAQNEVVFKWVERACAAAPAGSNVCGNSTAPAYPPTWNFAGKYLVDQCGRLRHAVGNSASYPWGPVGTLVEAMLAEAPQC